MSAVSAEARAKQNAAHREMYHWYVEHGICTRCGEQAVPGRTLCAKCKRKQRKYLDKADPDRSKHRQYNRDRRARLKAEGKCTWCGKADAIEGQTLCPQCKKKMDETRTVYAIRKRIKREAKR